MDDAPRENWRRGGAALTPAWLGQVWNQDDCFDVKDGTNNVIIEHVNASGMRLAVAPMCSCH